MWQQRAGAWTLLFASSTAACKTTFDLVPVSATEAERVTAELHTRGEARFTDLDGRAHHVDAEDVSFEDLTPVLANSPTRHQARLTRSVPDGPAIAGWTIGTAVVGGLIAANVACFGTNVCADGTSIAVGITDGALALTLVVAFVFLVSAWSH
jgi:hypothetical protein